MKKKFFPTGTFLSLCVFGTFSHASVPKLQLDPSRGGKKPNIVFILSDDVGWTGTHSFGSQFYETPNIDRLAREGVSFTQAYACAPVSAPSRAALMSGQYSPRNGTLRVTDVQKKKGNYQDYPAIQPANKPFKKSIKTMAEALKEQGYVTAMFGKWHIHPVNPGECGFDEWITSQGAHYNFKTKPKKYVVPKGTYLTDFMADHAISFIEENKTKPFFLYLPDYLVHKPHEAKQQLINKYKKKKGIGGHKDAVYAAMTEALDETVGRIYETLKKNNLLENTLIVFSSDNGAMSRMNADFSPKKKNFTDNLPLRSGKGSLYEGGIRVPYIFVWKGVITPQKESSTPIIGLDLYPTFQQMAGGTPDNVTLDGVSLVDLLKGKETELNKRALYWYYPNYGPAHRSKKSIKYTYIPVDAMIEGDYKLLEFYHANTEHFELYNLKKDIGERHDIFDREPKIARKMIQKLRKWQKENKAVRPIVNPQYQPIQN